MLTIYTIAEVLTGTEAHYTDWGDVVVILRAMTESARMLSDVRQWTVVSKGSSARWEFGELVDSFSPDRFLSESRPATDIGGVA